MKAYSGPKTESSALTNNTTGSFLQLVCLFLALSLLDTITAVSCGTMLKFYNATLFISSSFLFYFKGKQGSLSVGERLKKFLPTTSEGNLSADSNETLHMLLDLVSIYLIIAYRFKILIYFSFTIFTIYLCLLLFGCLPSPVKWQRGGFGTSEKGELHVGAKHRRSGKTSPDAVRGTGPLTQRQ